ncbi:MAG: hypothetical protein LQ350_000334 [Teloschistes chrysophthalmus]|nr:MAG: hypothetical protein LQ350_000334 [Niorma chrysophthalma]
MLKILPDESIALAGVVADTDAANLASVISDTEPRYTFFSYRRNTTTTGGQEGAGAGSVVFIYTCPSGSKIKERMVYASMRMAVLEMVGREGGVVVGRKIEASNPAEITAELVAEEVEEVKPEVKQGFARPKRPGKR